MKTFLLLLLFTGCGKGSISPVDCSQPGQACREASTFGPDKAAAPEAPYYDAGAAEDAGRSNKFGAPEPPPATHHPSLPTPKGDKVKKHGKPHWTHKWGSGTKYCGALDPLDCMPNFGSADGPPLTAKWNQQQPPTASDEDEGVWVTPRHCGTTGITITTTDCAPQWRPYPPKYPPDYKSPKEDQ